MEIVVHIGANCTDDDRLLKSLLRNAETLGKDGVKVPGPGKYRRLIRETIQGLNGASPPSDTRQILLDAILDDEKTERLVLSNSNFICIANRIFENGDFYALTEMKIRGFLDLFPGDDISFCLAVRNPATFIPATLATSKFDDVPTFMRGMRPADVRWSDLVTRIRAIAPDCPLSVWCNEDTPLIWGRLMRHLTDVPLSMPLVGTFDLLRTIMAPEGMKRMEAYLKANPPPTPQHEQKIAMAFLNKYAIEDLLDEELDLPDFTQTLVEDLTDAYDADVAMIAEIPGVTFIAP